MVDADVTILYSTIVAHGGGWPSLSCTNPGVIDVRNSMLIGTDEPDNVSCIGASFDNNLSTQNLGGSNVLVEDPFSVLWFDDYDNGNFGLAFFPAGVTPCVVAVWEAGDPPDDIDGEARPTMDGAPDCVGADVD